MSMVDSKLQLEIAYRRICICNPENDMQSDLSQTILISRNDLPICALLIMGKTIRARLLIHHGALYLRSRVDDQKGEGDKPPDANPLISTKPKTILPPGMRIS